jgi:nucleoside phosphorylase
VPLAEEFREVSKKFELVEDFSDRFGCVCYSAKLSGASYDHQFKFLLCHPSEWGNAVSQYYMQEITAAFKVHLMICIGIAGGISDDVRLGDVVVSSSVYDISERQKVTDKSTEYDTEPYSADDKLVQKIAFLKSHPNLQEVWEAWQINTLYTLEEAAKLAGVNDDLAVRARGLAREGADFQIGAVVSGPVGQSKKLKASIKSIKRKMLALETESGGVFRIGKKRNIPCLTIRGISDYSDGEKKRHENDFNGMFRTLAARNATDFFLLNIQHNGFFRSAILSWQDGGSEEVRFETDILNRVVEGLTEEIQENLSKYSSEFRAKPKGYLIPVPRVSVTNEEGEPSVLEPDEILSNSPVTLIELPINYPEKSLPWIYADYYIKGFAGGRIVLPILVDCSTLSPPSRGLSRSLDERLKKITTNLSYVYIIYNVTHLSKTRSDFVVREILSVVGGNVLIVGNLLELAQLREATRASSTVAYAKLMEISFLSITKFLANNFGIQNLEAETVAFKLREVFKKYEISTHPSYFAAISHDAIAALIGAHRRTELLNIAVQGYLAVSVLRDKGPNKLSVTTRRTFLRNVAYKTDVLKERISFDQAIAMVNTLSDEMDFDVKGYDFINSLIEAGILDVEPHGGITFTLPFVRAYLLAEALVEREEDALRYYDLEDDQFDQASYDVYCEIYHSDRMYERLVEELSKCEKKLKETFDVDRSVLLSSSISPKIYRDAKEVVRVKEHLERYVNKIENGAEDAHNKQRFLDFIDRVRVENQVVPSSSGTDSEDNSDADDLISSGVRKFFIGVVTLSAGSEKLNGADKRALVSLILTLGVSLISISMTAMMKIDLEEARKRFKETDFYKESVVKLEAGEAESFLELVEKIWAIVELKALLSPYMSVQNILGEAGGARLLYKSVQEAEVEGQVEKILQNVWLLELDPARASDDFSSLVKTLPPVRFLRTMIAQYLVAKGYWTQSSAEEKRFLSKAAGECIKPFDDLKFDKKKLLEAASRLEEM